MNPFMTIAEMRVRFPTGWVLIGDPQTDEKQQLVAGVVLWHSEDRDEVDAKAMELRPTSIAIRCFREPPKDQVFCLSPLAIEPIDEQEWDKLQRGLPVHVDKLRRLKHNEPFQPFVIHVRHGQQFRVHHPDYIAMSPTGRSAVVFQDDGGFEMIDLVLVTSLEVEPMPPHDNRRAGG